MPSDWKPKPTDSKYHTAEHRRLRAALVTRIKAGEALTCMAHVCVLGHRTITNPNGLAPEGLHLGHNDDGVTYRGPEHRACNLHDAAVRANARKQGKPESPTRWTL